MTGWQIIKQYWIGIIGILGLIFSILGFIGREQISKYYREKLSPRLHRLYEWVKSKMLKIMLKRITKEDLERIMEEIKKENEAVSGLHVWIDSKGGPSGLTPPDVSEILDSYLSGKPPEGFSFVPTEPEVYEVIGIYKYEAYS